MKKLLIVAVSVLMALMMFAACGQTGATSSSTSVADASTSASATTTPPVPVETRDLNAMYETVAAAVPMDSTVEVTLDDLRFSGQVDTDNIVSMVGAQSSIQNDSGMVLVLHVQAGTAAKVITDLEAFRDSYVNGPGYEEFAEAQEATRGAIISANGDYVIYAVVSVANEGDVQALTTAVAAALGA